MTACPSCGAEGPEGARTCPECGTPYEASVPPSESEGAPRLSRSGLFLILGGIAVATTGGLLTRSFDSSIGPILLVAGLVVFGSGLMLRQPG